MLDAVMPLALFLSLAQATAPLPARMPLPPAAAQALSAGAYRELREAVQPPLRACEANGQGQRCLTLLLTATRATLLDGDGDGATAERLARRALLLASAPGGTAWERARAQSLLGESLDRLGKPREAAALHDAAWATLREIDEEPELTEFRWMIVALAGHMRNLGARTEAKNVYRQGLEGLTGADDARDAALAKLSLDYAGMLRSLGRLDEAIAMYRRSLAIDRARAGTQGGVLSSAMFSLITALNERGQAEEAEQLARQLLANPAATDATSIQSILLLGELAHSLSFQGRYAEAEAMYRGAIAQARKSSQGDALLGLYLTGLGLMLGHTGRLAEAETALREVQSKFPQVPATMMNLGLNLWAQDKRAEAAPLIERAAQGCAAAFASLDPKQADCRAGYAWMLMSQGKFAQAEIEYRASLRAADAGLPPGHPRRVELPYRVAWLAMRGAGRLGEARATVRIATAQARLAGTARAGFDLRASDRMREYGPVFRTQVAVDWRLAAGER